MTEVYVILFLGVAFILAVLTIKGVRIVPQQQVWVVETLGRYDRNLTSGLNFLIPFVQKVTYKHSLKERAITIAEQTAITKDNVSLVISGILYVKVVDPKNASYGAEDPYYAIQQLAQTAMRSEIGRLTLDATFEEREILNRNIVTSINEASDTWGIQCMRYEIKDIDPPESVLVAMELQVEAERKKRAEILKSEGERQARINRAEGEKREVELESEAAMTDTINRARGEAEAIRSVAEATAESITRIGEAMTGAGGRDAATLKIAQEYVAAFANVAKQSTTMLLPHQGNDVGSAVAQAFSAFSAARGHLNGGPATVLPAGSPAGAASTAASGTPAVPAAPKTTPEA